jgi:hypothetical protein
MRRRAAVTAVVAVDAIVVTVQSTLHLTIPPGAARSADEVIE